MSTGSNIIVVGLGLLGMTLLAPSFKAALPPAPATAKRAVAPTSDVAPQPSQIGNGIAARELIRSPDGHFYADAMVNGALVHFMVDTGASIVALTRADAQRAGIPLSGERAEAIGAGGSVEVVPVTIERIAIGPLEARSVRGAVADQLPVSLLGQSYLEQVGSVEIRGDRMVLR
jgi:aspartyl protease family protein